MCTQHITPGIAVADGTDCLLTFTCLIIVNVTCTVCLINAKHWNITLMKFIAVTLCEYIIDVSSLLFINTCRSWRKFVLYSFQMMHQQSFITAILCNKIIKFNWKHYWLKKWNLFFFLFETFNGYLRKIIKQMFVHLGLNGWFNDYERNNDFCHCSNIFSVPKSSHDYDPKIKVGGMS